MDKIDWEIELGIKRDVELFKPLLILFPKVKRTFSKSPIQLHHSTSRLIIAVLNCKTLLLTNAHPFQGELKGWVMLQKQSFTAWLGQN